MSESGECSDHTLPRPMTPTTAGGTSGTHSAVSPRGISVQFPPPPRALSVAPPGEPRTPGHDINLTYGRKAGIFVFNYVYKKKSPNIYSFLTCLRQAERVAFTNVLITSMEFVAGENVHGDTKAACKALGRGYLLCVVPDAEREAERLINGVWWRWTVSVRLTETSRCR